MLKTGKGRWRVPTGPPQGETQVALSRRTHIHQGKRRKAGRWPPSWSRGVGRDDSGYAKSKPMEREQKSGRSLQDQDWAGLLRVGALGGESESWDLSSCFCTDQRSDDLSQVSQKTSLYKRGLANLSPKHE